MARPRPAVFAIVSLLFMAGAAVAYRGQRTPAVNPDPNHTHVDFAVWVNGRQLDFSDERYMSGSSTDETTYDEEDEHRHLYLHLHDGKGTVLHSHKPGQTLGDFFGSLGLVMSGACITLDTPQYESLDAGWKDAFAVTPELCTNGKFRWRMIVNGAEMPFDPSYKFADTDKILLTYGAGDMAYKEEWLQMTDDACLYSRTCPWRGDPPAENCIADPTVPCVVAE